MRLRLLLVLVMTSVLILTGMPFRSAEAIAAGLTVGVVDFYAQTPLAPFVGITPERFAAEDLSRLLTRAASGGFTVVPASAMQQAQAAMHWQSADVLHFDRLRELAQAVSADRLVVGWISLLDVESGGGHGFPLPHDGEGPPSATVNLVVQVFDRAAGRLVAETHQSASALGATRSQVAAQVLHAALDRGLPEVLRLLLAQAP